jgi:hypothetical protein
VFRVENLLTAETADSTPLLKNALHVEYKHVTKALLLILLKDYSQGIV